MSAEETLRQRILKMVEEYHQATSHGSTFVPGRTPVPVSGRSFDADDMVHLVDASLDFWLTAGPEAAAFERKLRAVTGHRHALRSAPGRSPLR